MKQILENIDSYINFSLRHVLSLLDRDFASKTLGCFDKNYWHYKYKAFPNSMMQTYLYSLSSYLKYIKNNTKKSHLISPDLLITYIKKSIDYTLSIQHSDGSCDEHYYYEKAQVATSFSLLAIFRSLKILKKVGKKDRKNGKNESKLIRLNKTQKSKVKKRLEWLEENPEFVKIGNHQAGLSLTFLEGFLYFQNWNLFEAFKDSIASLLELQASEGWFYEYEGLDHGYLTLTFDFMSQILYNLEYEIPLLEYSQSQRKQIEIVKSRIQNALSNLIGFLEKSFVPRLIFPLGNLGNRNNFHLFLSGFCTILKKDLFPTKSKKHQIKRLFNSIIHSILYSRKDMEIINDDLYLHFQLNDILPHLDFLKEHIEFIRKLPKDYDEYGDSYPLVRDRECNQDDERSQARKRCQDRGRGQDNEQNHQEPENTKTDNDNNKNFDSNEFMIQQTEEKIFKRAKLWIQPLSTGIFVSSFQNGTNFTYISTFGTKETKNTKISKRLEKEEENRIQNHTGYLIVLKNGTNFHSNKLSGISTTIKQFEGNKRDKLAEVTIKGCFTRYKKQYLSRWKQIGLNLLGLTLFRVDKIHNWIRKNLIQRLVKKGNKKEENNFQIKRKEVLFLSEKTKSACNEENPKKIKSIQVYDNIIIKKNKYKKIKNIYLTKGINTNYVPSGQNFVKDQYGKLKKLRWKNLTSQIPDGSYKLTLRREFK